MNMDDTRPPIPDPTTLTTDQLLREIKTLNDLTDSKLDGMRDLTAEKFVSVDTQFALVERQRVEQKKDTKDAVDAALAAAKEAVKEQTTASDRAILKSETSTAEQLKQLNTTFTIAIQGVVTSIQDLKERVDRGESNKQGAGEQRNENRAVYQMLIAGLGLLLAVALAYAALKP